MSDEASGFDAWGRRLSEDRRWYWDGVQWQENHSLPPLPYVEARATTTAQDAEPPTAHRVLPTTPSQPAVEAPQNPAVTAADSVATPRPEPGPQATARAEPAASSGVVASNHSGADAGLGASPLSPAPFSEISADGRWGWDGAEWVSLGPAVVDPENRQPPIIAPRVCGPDWPAGPPTTTAQLTPPAPSAPAGGCVFDPRGEAKRYPTMWRPAGRALRDVPGLLEPGEVVLATAPGEGDMAELRHLVGLTILTGYHFDPAYLLVATDRRVLALGLTASASKVQRVHAFPYGAITHWSARMSRAATLVTRTGFIALAAEPDEAAGMKRVPGHLLDEVRAQIEPRLDPSLLQGDRS